MANASGSFELCYLRDKDKRELDFLVFKDQQPAVVPARAFLSQLL